MLNFSFVTLIALFLITQNIFLLNEEALILVCFIVFCWSLFTKTQDSVSQDFIERSDKIKELVTDSLDQIIKSSNENLSLNKKSELIASDLKSLKKHFIKMNATLSNKLCHYSVQQSKLVYFKKLIFIQRLEQQSTKLLAVLLSKKLDKITLTRNFYTQKINVSNFLCFHKISLREYLESV